MANISQSKKFGDGIYSATEVDSAIATAISGVSTGGATALTGLSDVFDTMVPTDGQVLTFDTTNGWQSEDLPAGITDISAESIKDLSDVFSTMIPVDGQVLTFDTTNGWQAEDPAGGGTEPVTVLDTKTVGTGGDFATISEAITYFSNLVKGTPTTEILGEISILAGYDATETITVYNTNLAWVKISAIDAQVAGTFQLNGEGVSALPQIAANFANLTMYIIENSFVNINSDQGTCYLSAKQGSTILIPKSTFTAETLTMYSQSNSNIEAQTIVSTDGGGIYAQDGGVIHASYITMQRDATNINSAFMSIDGGRMSVDGINMDGYNNTIRNSGILVTNAGILNCGTINMDWNNSGFTVQEGSTANTGAINAQDCSASGGIVKVTKGSRLYAGSIDGARNTGSSGAVFSVTSNSLGYAGAINSSENSGAVSGGVKVESASVAYAYSVNLNNANGAIGFGLECLSNSKLFVYSMTVVGTSLSYYVKCQQCSSIQLRDLDMTTASTLGTQTLRSTDGSVIDISYSNLSTGPVQIERGSYITMHQMASTGTLVQTANTLTSEGVIYTN
jgi:hypothetical protein